MLKLLLLYSCIFQVISSNYLDVNNSNTCLQFIKYIYEYFKILRADLIYDLPKLYERNVMILVSRIFENMSKAALEIKPLYLKKNRNIFKNADEKILRIILEDTINMEVVFENEGYEVSVNSQWLFIGSKEMSWINKLKLSINSQVYLAKFSKNQITVNEVYSVSDKLVTNAIITWSNDDNNKRNELGLAYLKMLMYRRNMQGIIVNLLAFHDPPFVIINNGTNSTESPSIKGFLIDLWMIMEKERKFRTQIHYANSTAEGYLLKDETKTKIYSSGLLKEAEELQSDVTLMLRQDSTNFTNMFDATTSILTLRLGIYQKISRPGVWQLINQMPTIILFILLIFGILCGILLRLRRSGDSVVIVFASYFQQGYSMLPSNTSARFAVISLILCSTYVITINLAEVTALIIIRPSPKPLTLYDMLDPARKILIVQNSSLHNIMKENDTNLLGMILSRVKLNHGFVNSIYEGLQQVETHGFILLEFQERVSYYFIDFECSISRTLTDHRIYTALLVNWTLPYLTLIDYELIQMRENGILSKLIQKWWPERITYCMDKFEIVGLEKCWSLFAIYIYGAIIAVLILISEKNIPDYMKTRKKTTAEK